MLKKTISFFLILILAVSFSAVYAEEIVPLKGDINGNGVVNHIDFLLLSEYLEPNIEIQYDQKKDLNGDGIVDTKDLELLRQGMPLLELHGYYPKEIFKANNFNQKDLLKYFNDLSFAFYDITEDASTAENPSIAIRPMVLNENHIEALQIAKQNNIPIRFNLFSKMSILHKILPYAEKRQLLIQQTTDMLTREVVQDSGIYWNGVVIDFEEMRNTRINSINGVRENILYEGRLMSEWYVQFLQELRQALAAAGSDKDLYAAVPYSAYYDGYNYREIGNIADKVIVMAHDYEPKGSIKKSDVMLYLKNPAFVDSIAPASRIEKAIQALTNQETGIQDPKKIILQISFGTAQWKFPNIEKPEDWEKLSPETVGNYSTPSYTQIYQRMTSSLDPAIPSYIKVLESPYIAYYNSVDKSYNFILYEDSRSVAEKIKKVREAGLGGISLWSLGRIPAYENPIRDSSTLELYMNVWTQILESAGF